MLAVAVVLVVVVVVAAVAAADIDLIAADAAAGTTNRVRCLSCRSKNQLVHTSIY